MIYVDIFIVMRGEWMEVCFDAEKTVGELLPGLCRLIEVTHKVKITALPEEFCLCEKKSGSLLRPGWTLSENGVRNGDRLLFF